MTEKMTLGSGDVYCVVYNGTIPADATLETEENKLGAVKNGATLTYTAEHYTAKDDSGKYSKTITTTETVTLALGLFTWNGDTLNKICSTARVTEANGKRTVKIGGINNENGLHYIVRFVHKDEEVGDTRITIVGENTAGFTLAFAPGAETVVNPTFTAYPSDADGTLVIYEETIIPTPTLTVTSAAGSANGTTALTVSPAKSGSDTYVYKTGAAVELPSDLNVSGWTAWDGTSAIPANTGDVIVVVEITSGGAFKKFGTATVIAK